MIQPPGPFGSIDDTASPLTLRPTKALAHQTGMEELSFFGYLTTTTCTKSPDKVAKCDLRDSAETYPEYFSGPECIKKFSIW